jgi:hypothetical protein
VSGVSRNPGAIVWQWSCGNNDDNQLWAPQSVGGGYYQLVNRNSGLCMDIRTGGGVLNGMAIQQWTCDVSISSEHWLLQPVDPPSGAYMLITQAGGKCLDLSNGSSANGAKIQMWDCNSGVTAQRWIFK